MCEKLQGLDLQGSGTDGIKGEKGGKFFVWIMGSYSEREREGSLFREKMLGLVWRPGPFFPL